MSDNDIMITGLAGLPKEYGVIRTAILARESSFILKEFQAQLLGAKKEIEGEINVLSLSLSAMYVQGSNASSSFASSSNTQAHNHIPSSTVGTITMPYVTTFHIQDNSINNSLLPQNFQQPFYLLHPNHSIHHHHHHLLCSW